MIKPTLFKPKQGTPSTWTHIVKEAVIAYVKNLDDPREKFEISNFWDSHKDKLTNGSKELKHRNLYGNFRNLVDQNILLQEASFKSGEYKLNPALLEDIYPRTNSTIHNDQSSVDQSHPLNTILYGPPGTGKTYITKQKAVAVVTGSILSGEELNLKYKQLKESGIITFTTFHQSMGYEEFVEGLKAKADGGQVNYVVQAGILKQIVDKINQNEDSGSEKQQWETIYSIIRAGGDVWKVKPYAGYEDFKEKCFEDGSVGASYFPDIDFTGGVTENLFDEIYAAAKGTPQSMNGNYALARIFAHKRINGEVILLTPDNKHISAIGIIQGNYYYDKSNFPEAPHRRKVDWLLKDIDVPFTLFHSKGKTGHFNGVDAAAIDTDKIRDYKDSLQEDHTTLNHVLIIDEINRGNVSAIFGELITLLEDSKREGQPDALSVKLPYSGEDFILPSNLYIIGTMNTADRSVEALDTALRRRFVFEEMLPDISKLQTDIDGINVQALLTAINDRLTALKDKNHTIGHAYFMHCGTAVDVLHVLCFKVLPLLEEYFYGQQELIEVVLSSEFFVENKFEFAGDRKKLIEGLNLGESARKKTLKSGPAIYEKLRANDSEIAKLVNSITID